MGCERVDKAVVGIVVAVLLLGLIVAVMTMINLTYVPKWLKEVEASHMREVQNQFADLKYAIDMLALVRQHTAVSVPISLGASNVPIIGKGRTYDTLEIRERKCTVIIENSSGNKWTYKVGKVRFLSRNSYFINQEFVYECGAFILNQSVNSTILGKPIFTAGYDGLSFTIINITTPGVHSLSGHGTYSLWVEFKNSQGVFTIENVTYITVISDYPNAWETFFKNLFGRSDNPYSANMVSREGNKVKVDISNMPSPLSLRYVEILVDISLIR
ncbi:MAG: hypothetical protein DRN00_01360 [Thermoplasmata archaeon]|nr:MAG: hypothetical protein DRN00_01360 [Thermoplasmata archaeon]